MRPRSLTIALLSAAVGTFALIPVNAVRLDVAALCLLLALLLQAGTNVLNDAEDALTGADVPGTPGPSLAVRSGWISPPGARLIAAGCFLAATVTGVVLALWIQKPALLWVGGTGVVVGWAYTAPPLRLAYRPIGELASAAPMGVGITWGTAAAQATQVPAGVWWAAAPLAVLTASILHANNARDRGHDLMVGKRTLATHLTARGVVVEFQTLMAAAPLLVIAGVASGGLPVWCAVALLPGGYGVYRSLQARPDLDARGWSRLLLSSVRLHAATAVALCLGFFLSGLV